MARPETTIAQDMSPITSLLGGLESGSELVDGWVLAGVSRGEVIELGFTRAQKSMTVWLRSVDSASNHYARTDRFKVGHHSELPDGGLQVLEAVCARVRDHEGRLSKAARARLFEVRGQVDDLVLSWGALVLRLTLRCNENCPFCSASHAGDNLVTDPEVMHASIDRAAAMGAHMVVLTGGEPTLIASLPELVEHVHQAKMRCRIETNGVIPSSADYWRRFAQLPDELFVSFHSQHAERVGLLTGVAGTLARKIGCIKTAKSLGIEVTLNFVATPTNLDEVEAFPSYVVDTFGADVALTFSVTAPLQRAASNFSLVPRARDVALPLARALTSAKQLGVKATVPEVGGLPRCVLPANSGSFVANDRHSPPQPGRERARGSPDRVKAPTCRQCALDDTCIGIWRRYADVYGFDEFQPVCEPP